MNNKKKNRKKTFCVSKLYLNTLFLTMKNKSILTFKSQLWNGLLNEIPILIKKKICFISKKKKKSFKRLKKKIMFMLENKTKQINHQKGYTKQILKKNMTMALEI
jgi:hypothetical protein